MARGTIGRNDSDEAARRTDAGLPDASSTDNGIAGGATPTVPATMPSLGVEGDANMTGDGPAEGPAMVEMVNPYSAEGSRTVVPETMVEELEASGWSRASGKRKSS